MRGTVTIANEGTFFYWKIDVFGMGGFQITSTVVNYDYETALLSAKNAAKIFKITLVTDSFDNEEGFDDDFTTSNFSRCG